jgi:hypothetical protein
MLPEGSSDRVPQVIQDRFGSYFPREIIGEDETRRVLGEADWDEAEALLCNPEIECALLQALYERTEPFSTIPEERWLILVYMSAKNKRLIDCGDDEVGPDLGFMGAQEAIFKLLEIAAVTLQWLEVLYSLLDGLDPEHVARPYKIDRVLERWSAVIGADYKERPTSLEMKDEFRCLIAALYGKEAGYARNKTGCCAALRLLWKR